MGLLSKAPYFFNPFFCQPMHKYFLFPLALLWLVFSPTLSARAQPQQHLVPGQVLIKMKAVTSATPTKAAVLQKLAKQLKFPGFQSVKPFFDNGQTIGNFQKQRFQSFSNQYYTLHFDTAVTDWQAVCQTLNQQKEVAYAEPVPHFELLETPDEPNLAAHWGHFNAQVLEAWELEEGDTNVVIGVIDTGCDINHPSLANQLCYNEAERFGSPNFDDDGNGFVDDSLGYDFGNGRPLMNDPYGHGTEVIGVASAAVNDGLGTMGTGYRCKVMPIKILDERGFLRNAYQAMVYAAENGCDVINLSFGAPFAWSKAGQEIMDYITEELDVVVVAAAGNTSDRLDFYPASFEGVLSVGHSNRQDERFAGATYSYLLDLMAPGAGIPTTQVNNRYNFSVTGSSYAAPFVAGIAGLLRARYPELSARQIQEALRQGADYIDTVENNRAFAEQLGSGRVNAFNPIKDPHAHPSIALGGRLPENLMPDAIFYRGDTITWDFDGQNYLGRAAEGLVVTVTGMGQGISPLDSIFPIGTVEGTAAFSPAAPLRLFLEPALPAEQFTYLRFGYEAEGYQDFQYQWTYTGGGYHARLRQFKLSTSGTGESISYRTTTFDRAEGLLYQGMPVIRKGGAVFGNETDGIFSGLSKDMGNPSDFEPDSLSMQITDTNSELTVGFKNVKCEVLQNLSAQKGGNILSNSLFTTPIGVFEEESAWVGHSFVLAADSVQVAGYDPFYDFMYLLLPNGKWVGLKTWDEHAGYSLFLADTLLSNQKDWDFANMLRQAEKLPDPEIRPILLTAAKVTTSAIDSLAFDIVVGDSKQELQASLRDRARTIAYPDYFSPAPKFGQTGYQSCAGDTIVLTTTQADSLLYFYSSATALEPLHVGDTLTYPISNADTIWVSNGSRPILSGRLPLAIAPYPETSFGIAASTDTLYLNQTDKVFLFLSAEGPLTGLHWDLGNGTEISDAKTLFATYDTPGEYVIQATATNQWGCPVAATTTVMVMEEGAVTGIDPTFQQLTVYPNPTSSKVFVEVPQGTNCELRVYQSSGKLVATYKKKLQAGVNTLVNLMGYPQGSYLLTLTMPGKAPVIYKILKD